MDGVCGGVCDAVVFRVLHLDSGMSLFSACRPYSAFPISCKTNQYMYVLESVKVIESIHVLESVKVIESIHVCVRISKSDRINTCVRISKSDRINTCMC